MADDRTVNDAPLDAEPDKPVVKVDEADAQPVKQLGNRENVEEAVRAREKQRPDALDEGNDELVRRKLDADAGNVAPSDVKSPEYSPDSVALRTWSHDNSSQVIGNARGPGGGVLIVGPGPNYSAADFASAIDGVRQAESAEQDAKEARRSEAKKSKEEAKDAKEEAKDAAKDTKEAAKDEAKNARDANKAFARPVQK